MCKIKVKILECMFKSILNPVSITFYSTLIYLSISQDRFIFILFVEPCGVFFSLLFPVLRHFFIARTITTQFLWQFSINGGFASCHGNSIPQLLRHEHSKCVQNNVYVERSVYEFQAFHFARVILPTVHSSIK